ncbi:S-layer homology domain-containing protein [Geobacillus subterraneus]|uniref:S-layer homology domain-containing protein n=1 Tax=Geobacillus subterraneus TaxID=129338 RepID=UPI001609336D
MAYQPKSYRKFAATTATAAMVASAVAPVASLAAGFTDVASQYKEAVDFLVSTGATNGKTETQFGVYEQITRLDAAVILAKVLKLDVDNAKDAGFTDVPKDRAKYVNALVETGILNGKGNGKFGAYDNLTRVEMAKIIANAYKLEKQNDSALPFTDVNATWAPFVKALYDNGVTSGKTETSFGAYENITRGDFARFVYRAANLNVAPAVVSVSAINAKQIVVKFNTELEGQSDTLTNDATDVANYTLNNNIQPDSAVLSADKKSVTLTFNGGVEGQDQVLVINPVATTKRDKDGAIVNTGKYSTILTYTDTVAPTVVSTSYANGVIAIQFSEAIGTKPTVVRVNGVPVAASDISINSSDATKVEVSYPGLAAGSTASLYVAGAKDASVAQNEMDLFNGTVIAPAADTDKPHITAVQVTGQNTAKITLSEAINEATVPAKLQKGASIYDVNLVEDTNDSTGKTYTLTVDLNGASAAGDGIFSGSSTSETFSLLVAKDAMTDASNNKNDEFITSITFVKDTKAPTVTKTEVTTGNKQFSFSFDEPLTVAGSDNNIIVKNSDGVKIAVVDAETQLKADDDKIYLVDIKSGDVAIDPGTYTVTIPAGFFTDSYGNATPTITKTFTVGQPAQAVDTTKPVAVVSNVQSVKNVFEVSFKNGVSGALEEVTSSALNLNNYKLDGKPLPAGTEIYFTDTNKNTVRIELPEGSINIGDQTNGASAILTIANVQDKAGNVMNTSNHTVIVNDNTAATITNVQVIGKDVYVTFSEPVAFSGNVDADIVFDLTVNNTPVTAGDISAVAGNNKQVKFTLDNTPAATPVVKVKAGQTGLTDVNGVPVK